MTAIILQFASMTKKHETAPNRIREWRIKRDMTQAELAEASGLKQNVLSRMENGAVELSLTRLHVLAKELRVDVGQLLARDDNKFGLSEEALALMQRLQEDPRLVEPLAKMADTIVSFTPEPPAIEDRAVVVPMKRRRGPNRG